MTTSRESSFLFKPATYAQRQASRLFADSDILILTGQAGTGKTHCALGLAAQSVLASNGRIVISRPLVSPSNESVGFLPGKLDQKMHPWLLPLHDVLRRMTFDRPEDWIKSHCEICPLAFMRGRTFDRTVAILDEAQNATFDQLLMFLTRIGDKGKLILSGDLDQTDSPRSGLESVVSSLRKRPVDRVSLASLDGDINPRHPVIPKLIESLSPRRDDANAQDDD